MYQKRTATVYTHIFKGSAVDSLVFFSEYMSRTAILTQASCLDWHFMEVC